ncbi:hypothetical protein NXS19_012965 [Fusarium pseudograminearum]|nr:hypothetical protein NXS19_012965 [Fusarium pseudograminearum]
MTSTTDHEDSTETKVTEVAAPTPTPTPTFHGFPKLPPELRWRIWKEACLPRTKNDRAIQYVTADVVQENWDDDDFIVLDEDLDGWYNSDDEEHDDTGYVKLRALSGKKLHDSPPTNSAHLWDRGLWMACRESRDAIAEYLEINKWLKIASQEDEYPWFIADFPSTLIPHRKAKPWCPIVVPRRDIFCIAPIPFDWNIALKYDSSWNVNFPADIYELKMQNSPRGLLANWIESSLHEIHRIPRLWIIDDTTSWVRHDDMYLDVVYRDCDVEYVEVDWACLSDCTKKGDLADTADFLHTFAYTLEEEGDFEFLEILDNIGLLLRKDRALPPEAESEHEDGDIPDC